jgi:hypothetical protein
VEYEEMASNGGLSAMRMLSVAVVVLTAMVLFPLRMVSARKPPPNCVASGPCELCVGIEELSHESCQPTKRRQEYICRGGVPSKSNSKDNTQDPNPLEPSSKKRSSTGGKESGGDSEYGENDEGEADEDNSEKKRGGGGRKRPKDSLLTTTVDDDDSESSTAVIYRSCNRTAADDVRAVIWFEVWMAVIGGLSMWGVRVQKANNQTLYDKRLFKSKSRR